MDHLEFISEILASHGVHIQPDLFLAASTPSTTTTTTTTSNDATLQLWKATHDLLIVTLFLHTNTPLHQSDIRLSWKEFARRGPDAVRFEVIKSFVIHQLTQVGYTQRLSSVALPSDLLSAFVWLIAKCELVERYINQLCRVALRNTPFAAARGNRVWSPCSTTRAAATATATPLRSPPGATTATPTLPDLTHRITMQCGALWHAVREMAVVEDRRTLLLQRICEQQVVLRPSSTSRLLLPIEVTVAIAHNEHSKRIELDAHIEQMKSVYAAQESAIAFWQWCDATLSTTSSSTCSPANETHHPSVPINGTDWTQIAINQDETLRRVESIIVDQLGLLVRKP